MGVNNLLKTPDIKPLFIIYNDLKQVQVAAKEVYFL